MKAFWFEICGFMLSNQNKLVLSSKLQSTILLLLVGDSLQIALYDIDRVTKSLCNLHAKVKSKSTVRN